MGTTALLAIFLAAAGATWIAGVALADATDAIDDRFNLGEAIGGLILLGVAGTLPELAITASAAVSGNFGIAAGNLLGGIAMQTLVLALMDATSGSRSPLSSMSKVLEPIIEAAFVIILVSFALMGTLLPESATIGSVSPASLMIVVFWLFGLMVLNRLRSAERWQVADAATSASMMVPVVAAKDATNRYAGASTAKVLIVFGICAAVTLVAGVVLEQTGNDLANAWGVNGVVFGATVLAVVTALPEISTGIRAVRTGHVGLAMGDIFGGNQVQMTLFLLADLLAGKAVLPAVDASSTWLGGIGVVVTAIYAGGLILRPPKKIAGMGGDSWIVLLLYIFGIAGLLVLAS
jgi:cation:H+ antiporter